MPPSNPGLNSFYELIEPYIYRSRDRRHQISVEDRRFYRLPETTQELINKVLRRVESEAFGKRPEDDPSPRLVACLSLVLDALRQAGCSDQELLRKIVQTREKVAETITERDVGLSEEDMVWLKQRGFLPINIFETMKGSSTLVGMMAFLREFFDESVEILGNKKYVFKILGHSAGVEKLKQLKLFFRSHSKNSTLRFTGAQLYEITFGADGVEKLKYLAKEGNIRDLEEIGFKESTHFNWVMTGKDWREKWAFLKNKKDLEKLTKVGFRPCHLAQMIRRGDWQEKFKWIMSEEGQALLRAESLSSYQWVALLEKTNWRECIKLQHQRRVEKEGAEEDWAKEDWVDKDEAKELDGAFWMSLKKDLGGEALF